MIVLSIDPAKKTGFVKARVKDREINLIGKGSWTLHKKKFSIKEIFSKLNDIDDGSLFKDVDLVLVEAQGGNLNAHNNGMLKGALLKQINCPNVIFIHPRTWQSIIKKRVGEMGLLDLYNNTKEISLAHACNTLKIEISDDNIADAYNILYYWVNYGDR